MSKFHRIFLLVCIATLAGLALGPTSGAVSQVAKPGDPAKAESAPAIALPVDKKQERRLEAAQDFLKEEQWQLAVDVLQSIFDRDDDVFIEARRKGPDGKESKVTVSARAEADRIFGMMPAKGREVYQAKYGPLAADLLQRAKKNQDAELLAKIARSYVHTEAAAEALQLLAVHHFDRGHRIVAAPCFERLLQHPASAAQLTPVVLFKVVVAFRHAGDKSNAEKSWKLLATKLGKDGLSLGEKKLNLEQLQKELEQIAPLEPTTTTDWLTFGGLSSRAGQGVGGAPFLEFLWKQHTIRNRDTHRFVLDQAVRQRETRGDAILPAFFPIAVEGKLIYRSFWGIHAIDLNREGKLIWETPSHWSVDRMLNTNNKTAAITQWINTYNQMGQQQALYENSTIGTLSSDGVRVYVIEDLALPPINPPTPMPWGQEINQAIMHNRLQAYVAKDGKFYWEAGGPVEKKDGVEVKEGIELKDSYFLGPPLPLDGKVYVLNQKDQVVRLLCLDAAKATLLWSLPLAAVRDKHIDNAGRRMQAALPSYSQGILVCPTNAGAIVGVDLLSRSLAWAHLYEDKKAGPTPEEEKLIRQGLLPQRGGAIRSSWKASAPVIQEGKVVFTPPEGNAIHCLNLRDGSLVWKGARAEKDLYLAGVFQGRAIIVGKESCRALDLADGKQVWQLTTGMPSGYGVASANMYYLPLKSAAQTKEPEVCVVDINKGIITAHVKSRTKETPGNLLFHGGEVISQTVSEIVAYPQLKAKLEQINKLLDKDPKDPVGLTERADLRLDSGDLIGAVEDLRTALANKPPPQIQAKAKGKLYGALTELLRRDFKAAEKYLDEYKGLVELEVPPEAPVEERNKLQAEQLKRRTDYFFLLARGREQQGRLTDALDAYLEFLRVPQRQDLLAMPDDPALKVRPHLLVQGRITAMLGKATADERKVLEGAIAEKYRALKAKPYEDESRQFVAIFGSHSAVGREARFLLAERLVADPWHTDLLEAERHFLELTRQRDDPQLAARAVEALAVLMIKRSQPEDSMHYYRILNRDFAKVVIRDGKTGADVFAELATDKRFIPYLDEPGKVWFGQKIRAREEPGDKEVPPPLYTFASAGEAIPYFQRYRIALHLTYHQFKLVDRLTQEEKWTQKLTETNFRNYLSPSPQQNLHYSFYSVGHLVILPVGHMVFGIDPISKKLLWEKNLAGTSGAPPELLVLPDPRDGGWRVLYQDGWVQKLGHPGFVEPFSLCLLTRDGLTAFDPISGNRLWVRGDVEAGSQVFGDERHLILVERGPDVTAVKIRAFRLSDGSSVPIPDGTRLYQHRLRTLGCNLLLAEADAKGVVTQRLYDLMSGKDLWKKEYPAKSIVLASEEPELAGAVDPEGKVSVVDLTTQKEVLRTSINAKHIEGARSIHLLRDSLNYYLAINGPDDPKINLGGGPWPNVTPGSGIRTLPVNGEFYAFRRDNEVFWHWPLPYQQLVLEHFREMPMVLFTAQMQKPLGPGGRFGVQQVAVIKSLDKRTGKHVYDRPDIPNEPQFYALNMDEKTGRIEFLSPNRKIIFTVVPEK